MSLAILAEYLEGPLKADFDMGCFGEEDVTCGSVGCALGHGPYAGIVKLEDESWTEYCERAFGVCYHSNASIWMFSTDWIFRDNTSKGAAKRIRRYLERGVPRNFREQMSGIAEYENET